MFYKSNVNVRLTLTSPALWPSNMKVAAITWCTPSGGLVYDLISAIVFWSRSRMAWRNLSILLSCSRTFLAILSCRPSFLSKPSFSAALIAFSSFSMSRLDIESVRSEEKTYTVLTVWKAHSCEGCFFWIMQQILL